jgi:probable rRNA maturation factor
MRLDLSVQLACATVAGLPDRRRLRQWVSAAVKVAAPARPRASLTLRVVDEEEGRTLNRDWRSRDYATNVLSFPVEGLSEVAPELLGDLVICAPVMAAEARAAGRALDFHWAHLVVHGTLHLLGHDHEQAAEAAAMEAVERDVLSSLGYPDPYPADEEGA